MSREPVLRILGVHFNEKLTLDSHIEILYKNACQGLHLLRVLKQVTNPNELPDILMHLGTIKSIFDYCCPLFINLPHKLAKRIRKIERRAQWLIVGNQRVCDCALDSFVERRKLVGENFFKIRKNDMHNLHDRLPEKLPHNDRLQNMLCRTNTRQDSFFALSASLHNQKLFTRTPNNTYNFSYHNFPFFCFALGLRCKIINDLSMLQHRPT